VSVYFQSPSPALHHGIHNKLAAVGFSASPWNPGRQSGSSKDNAITQEGSRGKSAAKQRVRVNRAAVVQRKPDPTTTYLNSQHQG